MEKQGFTPQAALNVGTQIHTSPAQSGKVMAETQPRIAVGYHFFNDFDAGAAVQDAIRQVYDGSLTLAKDMMVWNVTPERVIAREIAYSENSWPVEEPGPDPNSLALGKFTPLSEFISEGAVFFPGVISPADACERWPGVEIPGVECG